MFSNNNLLFVRHIRFKGKFLSVKRKDFISQKERFYKSLFLLKGKVLSVKKNTLSAKRKDFISEVEYIISEESSLIS